MVKDVRAVTTLACLKNCFAILSPPKVLIPDNATGLNNNLQIAVFLRLIGVTYVSTISPYNSKANKTEIRN
jgi:thioester reductase-like protein